jgi:PKD repeat protein
MRRRSVWIAAAVCGVAAGLVALSAYGPTRGPAGVSADTASPTASPSPSPVPAPAVTVAATPTPGQSGQQTTFVATVTNAPAGATLTYQWTFGDGGSGNSATTTHTYAAAGSYTVQVVVFGAGASPLIGTLTYAVLQSLALNANGPYTGQVGQPINFKATAQGSATLPADTVYTWDFGDGTARTTGAQIGHVYVTTGSFTVTLTAASAATGQTGSVTTTATVTSGPTPAQFAVAISGPSQTTAGQTVSYQASVVSGTAPADIGYSWNWGDGSSPATGQSASHSYASAGSYTIMLTATSAATPANSASATTSVNVSAGSSTGGSQSVTYLPGWNLVGGPGGQTFSGANNPLYTFQAGDANYETVANTAGIASGKGYWAFFTSPTTITLIASSTNTASVQAPAGQYVMIGNPSASQTLTIHGADQAFAFDPIANSYVVATTLKPGQGAWVISINGATITVGP